MDQQVAQFTRYFEQTWFNEHYHLWVVWVYDEEGPRTNNHVEGWHNKLNKIAGQSPPNIYEVVKLFKTEQAATEVTLRHLEAGGTIPETRKCPGAHWNCLLESITVLHCKLYPPVKSNTSFVSRTVMKIEQNEQNKNKNKLKTAITSAYWEWQVVTTRK